MATKIVNIHYYYVGIDVGVHTGVVLWNSVGKKFEEVKCMPIHKAMDYVRGLAVQGYDIQVRYEDDGSRDSGIWEAFLEDEGISFLPIPMKKNRTKLTKAMFEKMTGWRKATNEHSRDAAMLVYGL